MAHQVEKMFFVGETPWHGLGHYFETPPKTIEEILPAAGLDWSVQKTPIFDAQGNVINGYSQLTRCDNGKTLHVVGNRYEPMQNADALQSLMPLIESGDAEIETAGSLDGGKKIWFLLRSGHLKETELSNGETINNYFLFSTSHDGSRANRMGKTGVRVVCANTLHLSDRDSSVAFRHTKGQVKVLDTLVAFANQANAENDQLKAAYEKLLCAKIDHRQLEEYVRQVFSLGDSTRAKNMLAEITGKAYFGRGNGHVRGTWWAALNAVTEQLSHHAGRTAETRYKSLWFGANSGVVNKATVLALKAVS